MLKHKRRERREERGEKRRGEEGPCAGALGFLSRSCSSGDPKMLELERLRAVQVLILSVDHRAVTMLGASCAVGSHTGNCRAGAEWEITALGELARKIL